MTQRDKERLLLKEQLLNELKTTGLSPAMSRATEKILQVTPIMQETNKLCAAATAQMILSYWDLSYDSQQTIIKEMGSGPSLQGFMNYINSKQSNNTYIRKTFDSQAALDQIISVAYMVDNPIVFTLKADSTDVEEEDWPYPTGGHFTILRGIRSDDLYSIGDPFYYKKWVSSATANNGLHNREYDDLVTVNLNQGKGENYLAY